MANDIQELIQQMNQAPPDLGSPPKESSNGQPPAQPTTPAATVPPTEPAKIVPTEPAKVPPAVPTEPKTPAQQPVNNTAPTEPKAGDTPSPTSTPVEVDVPDPVFYSRLSKMTEGSIKSEQDLVGVFNHYNDLLEQAEQGFQPQFKDERTKMAYQLMIDNPGREPEAAMRTLRAIAFNPEGKSAQDVLFEAYLLDPKNSDLGPIEAQEYFKAEYDKLYSDIEENPLTKRQQVHAVREATAAINNVKEGFKAVEEQPRQISEQVERGIFEAVEDFGGVKLAFTDNPQDSDYLSMAIEDPQELESLKQDAANPQQWWNNFMQEFVDDKGKFNYPEFVREFYEMRNHRQKTQLAYQHGRNTEERAWINKQRNASSPTDPSVLGSAPVAQPAGPKNVMEAWAQAQGVKL